MISKEYAALELVFIRPVLVLSLETVPVKCYIVETNNKQRLGLALCMRTQSGIFF